MTLDDIISTLDLKPHPEGGWYRQTHRIEPKAGERSPGTAIYYALGAGERSHWHHVDATEIWHWYAGAPLELSLAASDHDNPVAHVLGPDLAAGQRPQGAPGPRLRPLGAARGQHSVACPLRLG